MSQGVDSQCYRAAHPAGRTLTIHFNTECEEISFPTALASMLAKYLRELHMLLFNRWWRAHMPELRPTAGYHTDAHRFLADVEPLRTRLGIDPALLVRKR